MKRQLREARQVLGILWLVEKWSAHLDAGRNTSADGTLDDLRAVAQEVIDDRKRRRYPSFGDLYGDAEEAAEGSERRPTRRVWKIEVPRFPSLDAPIPPPPKLMLLKGGKR